MWDRLKRHGNFCTLTWRSPRNLQLYWRIFFTWNLSSNQSTGSLSSRQNKRVDDICRRNEVTLFYSNLTVFVWIIFYLSTYYAWFLDGLQIKLLILFLLTPLILASYGSNIGCHFACLSSAMTGEWRRQSKSSTPTPSSSSRSIAKAARVEHGDWEEKNKTKQNETKKHFCSDDTTTKLF